MKMILNFLLVGLSAVASAQDVQPFCQGGKWGYVSKGHAVVVPASLGQAEPFHQGLARARQVPSGAWGYLNPKGGWQIPCQFAEAQDFFESVACVKNSKTGLYQLIDVHGKPIEGTLASAPITFSEGLAALIGPDRHLKGWLDGHGKRVITTDEAMARKTVQDFAFHDGLALFPQGGSYGYVDLSGKVVVPPQFYDAHPFSQKRAGVRKGSQDLWGFINPSGENEIRAQFSDFRPFHNGMAAVRSQGHWGMINRGGKFTVFPRYQAVSDCHQSFVAVRPVGQSHFESIVDSRGEEVLKLPPIQRFDGVWAGKFVVADAAGLKILDVDGKPWAPPGVSSIGTILLNLNMQYDEVRHRLGVVWAKDHKLQMVVVLDENGKLVFRTPGNTFRFLDDGRTEVNYKMGEVPLLYYVDPTGNGYAPET